MKPNEFHLWLTLNLSLEIVMAPVRVLNAVDSVCCNNLAEECAYVSSRPCVSGFAQ
jgi:hypothetical protein